MHFGKDLLKDLNNCMEKQKAKSAVDVSLTYKWAVVFIIAAALNLVKRGPSIESCGTLLFLLITVNPVA